MKKIVLTLLGATALSIAVPINAAETNTTNNFEGPRYERIYSHSYSKTVTKYYNEMVTSHQLSTIQNIMMVSIQPSKEHLK